MENASKALIIAGAILLSIMIIGLGITIFNNVKDQTGTDTITDQKILTYNSKFEQYEGSRKKGSEVKTLLSAVVAANGSQDAAVTPVVQIRTSGNNITANAGTSASNTISTIKASIVATASYEVTVEYDDGSTVPEHKNYINAIVIRGL